VIAFDPFTSVGGQVQNRIYVRAGLFFILTYMSWHFLLQKLFESNFHLFFKDYRAALFLNLKIGNDKVRWQRTCHFTKVGIDDALFQKSFASQEHLEKEKKPRGKRYKARTTKTIMPSTY